MIAPRPASKWNRRKLEFRHGIAGSEKIDHGKAISPTDYRAGQSRSRLMMQAAASTSPVVFVVDDDFDVCEVLKSLLESVGLRAEVFGSTPGAVEFLTKPVREQDLFDAINVAFERDRTRRANGHHPGARGSRRCKWPLGTKLPWQPRKTSWE